MKSSTRISIVCLSAFCIPACVRLTPTPLAGAASGAPRALHQSAHGMATLAEYDDQSSPNQSAVRGEAQSLFEKANQPNKTRTSTRITKSSAPESSAIIQASASQPTGDPFPPVSPSLVPAPGTDEPSRTDRDRTDRDQSAPDRSQAEDSSVGMTLGDLERMALEFNPTLRQAAWTVDKVRGIRHQTGRYPNPTVGYQAQEVGSDGTAGQQGAFLSQTIVTANKLQLGQDVVDQDVHAYSWEVQAQQLRVATDLELSYVDALGAQRRMELAEQLVNLAEKGVDVARQLFEAKEGAKPDVLQAEILLSEVGIIRRNAEIDYETAWRKLAGIIGRPEMVPVPLAGDIRDQGALHELEQDYERLISTSPELQIAQARVQRAQALMRFQEAKPIPNVLTQFGIAHDNSSGDELAGIQVGLPLPVFNRNRGNIAAAHAEYHRACDELERLRLDLRVRLNQTFQKYAQAKNRVERIENEILPRAEESRELTEQAYQLGEFGFLRVLTARRTYFEANLRYVEALTELRKSDALIDGLLLSGGLDRPSDFTTNVGLRGKLLNTQ